MNDETAIEERPEDGVELYELKSPRVFDYRLFKSEIDLLNITSRIEETRRELKSVEDQVTDWVCESLNADMKPTYPNERKRQIAIAEMLGRNDDYVAKRARLTALEREKAEATVYRDSIHRRYRISLIDYEEKVLGRRVS